MNVDLEELIKTIVADGLEAARSGSPVAVWAVRDRNGPVIRITASIDTRSQDYDVDIALALQAVLNRLDEVHARDFPAVTVAAVAYMTVPRTFPGKIFVFSVSWLDFDLLVHVDRQVTIAVAPIPSPARNILFRIRDRSPLCN